jgi:ABC-2 type transport system ATP-binding protein
VISSHILAELADLCTHIAIVDGGKVLASGPIDEVSRRLHGGRSVRISVLGQGERLRDLLAGMPLVQAIQLDSAEAGAATAAGVVPAAGVSPDAADDRATATVRFVYDGDEAALRALLAELVQAGVPIVSFGQDDGGLEAIFLQVTRRLGDDQGAASA